MLKRPETIVLWRHWFGRSLRPGKPSNSPRGAEDASMVRRAPFPLSSLPASIEYSMKLLCVCVTSLHGSRRRARRLRAKRRPGPWPGDSDSTSPPRGGACAVPGHSPGHGAHGAGHGGPCAGQSRDNRADGSGWPGWAGSGPSNLSPSHLRPSRSPEHPPSPDTYTRTSVHSETQRGK